MALTNSRSQEHSNAPSLSDTLHYLQRVNRGKSTALTGLLAAKHASYAPNPEKWLTELDLLQRLEAELAHGPMRIGQVVDGWALVKRTPIGDGDVLSFKAHRPRGCSKG
jgi:hypothetical protein